MSTTDISAADGQLLYIRYLIDRLADTKIRLEQESRLPDGRFDAASVLWLNWLNRKAAAFEHFDAMPSWDDALQPMLDVGVKIAAWRDELAHA